MSTSPIEPEAKRSRLDEAPAVAETLTTSASVGSGASHSDATEEKARAGSTAGWVDSTTMAFPEGLPMEHKYLEREFYVRACYPRYHNIVLQLLSDRNMEVVTFTRTPGIGKSVFYAYFLKRFSFECEEAMIITASFNSDSVMKKVAMWKGGSAGFLVAAVEVSLALGAALPGLVLSWVRVLQRSR